MLNKNSLSTKKIILFLCLFIILISAFLMIYFNSKIIKIEYVDFDYKVKGANNIGFNAETDALHFGIIAPGSGGIRDLELESDERANVMIKVIGSDYVFPNRNDFIIEPNKKTSVQFIAEPPLDTPPGNYSGKVRIVFKKV